MNQTFKLGKKRSVYFDVTDFANNPAYRLDPAEKDAFTRLDVAYRTLVSLLYN